MYARRAVCIVLAALALSGAIAPAASETSIPDDLALPWQKVDEGVTGEREGSVFFYAPGLERLVLMGRAEGAPCFQAFDPAAKTWSELSSAAPPIERFNPYYQTAFDPATKTIFCLSGANTLFSFDLEKKAWKKHAPAAALEALSWHAMACDPARRKLLVIGADKQAGNLGWTRTVVYDIPSGSWTRLDVADEAVVKSHRALVDLKEAVIDLVGGIRLAWFRDPKGVGGAEELAALAARCGKLKDAAGALELRDDVEKVVTVLAARATLGALVAAHALQLRIEVVAERQWPVPCSRRNSPLAFDAKHGVFVLFGGDHEDYLMNDTWVLDLGSGAWRRMHPAVAPRPRAGHALFPLLQAGGVALYEGYVQTSSTDYGAAPYRPAEPVDLWRYDPAADRWELLGAWRHVKREGGDHPPPLGYFYGYASDCYSPPAVAAGAHDEIVVAGHPGRVWYFPWKELPARTWVLARDLASVRAASVPELGAAPDSRLYRTGAFRASFCEVADAPADTGLDRLPANTWVKLPSPPRQPCSGCRQRDWGTSVWDSDRDQILCWGGGHCVRSASCVVHASPVSGRIVESYDADEPYGANGGGGFDSSLLNRPWVAPHNYNHYAYDPVCKLLVSARGYMYDPERMDWLRMEPIATPFRFDWGHTVLETSAHGAVAWAQKKGSEDFGLWLFDRRRGWTDLEPRGTLFGPYCDAHGMVYDAARDRMLLSGVGGSYEKPSAGTLLAFDFATRALAPLSPKNPELARTRNARELAYIDHADWILVGEQYPQPSGTEDGGEEGGESKKAPRRYTRVYDCGRDAWCLLDAGRVPDGHSTGWMYDRTRRLAYVFTFRGELWALRIEPASATLLETIEGER